MPDGAEMTCVHCRAAFLAKVVLGRLPQKYCGPGCRKAAKAVRQAEIWRRGREACGASPIQEGVTRG